MRPILSVVLSTCTILLFLLFVLVGTERFQVNRAYLGLSRAFFQNSDQAKYAEAADAEHRFRGLSLSALPESARQKAIAAALTLQDKAEEASRIWRTTGLSYEVLVNWGEAIRRVKSDHEAAIWFQQAAVLDPDSPLGWLHLGRFCQSFLSHEVDACKLFLTHERNNWLIDSDFESEKIFTLWNLSQYQFVFSGWFPYELPSSTTGYAISQCPGLMKRCGMTRVTVAAPANGAGLWQCLHLVVNAQYKFSAWLRVESEQDSKWRPLYFEGNTSEGNRGHWPGGDYQQGASDWQLWEYQFTAPAFVQQGFACFSPIRLEGQGKTWFHSPRLEMITQGKVD